jgi:hypothetical protein
MIDDNLFIFSGEENEVFKPYQFKMDEIEGFRYRARVSIVIIIPFQ